MKKLTNAFAKRQPKQFFAAIIALVSLYFSSLFMLNGSGKQIEIQDVLLLSALILIFNASRKAFYAVIIPIAVAYTLYAPVGMMFGEPNYQYLASVLATNLAEGSEFLQQIPLQYYLMAIAIVPLLLLFRYLSQRFQLKFYKNKTLLCFILFFALVNQSPFSFFHQFFAAAAQVKDELVRLNQFQLESRWGASQFNGKYKNYVLVIGESVRRDYMHAYGYPIENTPFMESTNGIVVEGLESAGSNTIASLRLMLTKPDKQRWAPDYSLNLIDLIKSAGVKTYWLSNQGFFGQFDTPITAIADLNDEHYFIAKNDSISNDSSDLQLIEPFKQILQQPSDKAKFIVVHLYGSHPKACDRIKDYQNIAPVTNKKYQYLSCYVSSIRKTDQVLQQLYQALQQQYQQQQQSFSMIYFADHGLAHKTINNEILFFNNAGSPLHHDVPLFMTASDSQQHQQCSSFKSGLNFTEAIANWMEIKNQQVSTQFNLFDCKNDSDDYGLKQRLPKTKLDPAIDIRNK
ncbi:phosphoethanolamine transferase [Gallibacterium anatis]|uniref:phosphoethanolamine transferase n=1 Tax=Gallibacterium anatis TaxID=750 RepID=UPI00254C1CB2|nr:phosphoethanolamine transferase [Gallibacterium anatis]WIM83368.1 phosphoethanolamine transferase [Gallibacterium anatis]